MSLLLDALFNSVAYGHFIVDALSAQRAVLLTYWSEQSGMSNTMLALFSTLYVLVASLSQPIFGWAADRFAKSRLYAAGGILWMTTFFVLALTLPVGWAIPCLILAALGSAAFHPVATMHAILRGRTLLAGRETTSTAWFFLFGQVGYFMGPIAGGPLLEHFGPPGLLVLAIPALVIGLNASFRLGNTKIRSEKSDHKQAESKRSDAPGKWFVISLVIVAALQAWSQQNLITFLPKYLSDLGQTPTVYGFMSGLFMGGSGLGNVLGGHLADRFGRKPVIATALALASIPLLLLSSAGWSPWLYLLVPLSGMFTGSVHSIIVVQAQRVVRGGMALASGLTLGFIFSAGALGTLLSGPLADSHGVPVLFQMTAGLVVLASLAALTMKEKAATRG